MTDVLTFGETLVAVRRAHASSDATLSVAGSESNVAIGLARLGHDVEWAGRTGRDGGGRDIRRVLAGEGVGVRWATIDEERPTGVAFFERRLPGLVTVDYVRAGSAATRMSEGDLVPALSASPRILHVTGITCAIGLSGLVERAVDAVRDAGGIVSLDVNQRDRLWSREEAARAVGPIARRADVVIGSPDEILLAAGMPAGSDAGPGPARGADAADAAHELLSAGVGEVVVKLGGRGARVHAPDGVARRAAVAADAVDTVGAGDAFTAGYLSALLDGGDLAARLERGVLLGAFAVSGVGDWEGLPTREELTLLADGEEDVRR